MSILSLDYSAQMPNIKFRAKGPPQIFLLLTYSENIYWALTLWHTRFQYAGYMVISPNACLAYGTAILVEKLFLTPLCPSPFSPHHPDHTQQEFQARVPVVCGMFSWINKSPSLLGPLTCEANPMPRAMTVPLGCHHKVPPSTSLPWWFGTIFKTRGHFIQQKSNSMPVGNRAELFPSKEIFPDEMSYTHKGPIQIFLLEASTG